MQKTVWSKPIARMLLVVLILMLIAACGTAPAGNVVNLSTVNQQATTETETIEEDETTTPEETEEMMTAEADEDTDAEAETEETTTPEEETATSETDEDAEAEETDETATTETDEESVDTEATATSETDEDAEAEETDETATTETDEESVDAEATATPEETTDADADMEETTDAEADETDAQEATTPEAEVDAEAEEVEETDITTDTMVMTDTDVVIEPSMEEEPIILELETEETDITTDTMVMTDTMAMTGTMVMTDTMPMTKTIPMTSTVEVTHGPISGEVHDTSAIIWARGEMTGTIVVDVAETPAFTETHQFSMTVAKANDYAGDIHVTGLHPEKDYYYRIVPTEESEIDVADQEPGLFSTTPMTDSIKPFDFVFGACLGGGEPYCRSQDTNWIIFDAMAEQEPDFFMLLGDSIYADSACGGDSVPGAEGPYSDLEGFHTRYRYQLEDESYASFLAQTPVYVTWDDHEILDNFGGPDLSSVNPDLFEEGRQAFFDYWPLAGTDEDPMQMYRSVSYGALADFFILDTRSYRDPNVNWDPSPITMKPKSMLGAEQFAWLQSALAESDATWKFIVTSVPLSYPTGYPQPQVDGRDGWANYTERSGFENELMSLIFFIENHDVSNVVFLAGDTHWPYAISYDPDRDGEANFHEFGSSPMSSLPLEPPETLDLTFNPTVLYQEGEFAGELFNFGHIAVDEEGNLTFRVVDWQGNERYSVTVPPMQ